MSHQVPIWTTAQSMQTRQDMRVVRWGKKSGSAQDDLMRMKSTARGDEDPQRPSPSHGAHLFPPETHFRGSSGPPTRPKGTPPLRLVTIPKALHLAVP
mmetsp:Transcript_26198/g.63373  ORF Transcript_26198/g.63373 Transcript_26198/m.63373 type:complete len:98 (+) Transcript_26198:44-337(+)